MFDHSSCNYCRPESGDQSYSSAENFADSWTTSWRSQGYATSEDQSWTDEWASIPHNRESARHNLGSAMQQDLSYASDWSPLPQQQVGHQCYAMAQDWGYVNSCGRASFQTREQGHTAAVRNLSSDECSVKKVELRAASTTAKQQGKLHESVFAQRGDSFQAAKRHMHQPQEDLGQSASAQHGLRQTQVTYFTERIIMLAKKRKVREALEVFAEMKQSGLQRPMSSHIQHSSVLVRGANKQRRPWKSSQR
eukprot:TRINITY_DN9440_c1_g1_i4.p1 TRINITY_DN9440_c1_g1~~TRINITY_DN9440_c1_g1_i4.p1  ORF type:complete len:270 (+),score=36.08 TRINITY_DN9440_c1_g1_i4:61-810(+)